MNFFFFLQNYDSLDTYCSNTNGSLYFSNHNFDRLLETTTLSGLTKHFWSAFKRGDSLTMTFRWLFRPVWGSVDFRGNLRSVTNGHEYSYHEPVEIYGDRVPYPVPRRINLISIVPLTICRRGRFSKSILSNSVRLSFSSNISLSLGVKLISKLVTCVSFSVSLSIELLEETYHLFA